MILKLSLVLFVWCCCCYIPFITAYYVSPQPAGGPFSFCSVTKERRTQRYFPQQCQTFLQLHRGRPFISTSLTATRAGQNDGEKPKKKRSWDESYARLLEFTQEHGHPNVPHRYKEDPKLGEWLANQRRRRHSINAGNLSKLKALNITWDGVQQEKYDQRWEDKFQRLQKYKEMEGDCRVLQSHPKLGSWVANQRSIYKAGKLASYRIEKLESIGFVWRLKEFQNRESDLWEEKWEKKFEELQEYQKENGHCQVPQSYPENPSLGWWVDTQRARHADGDLRQDRKEMLEEIGFTWNFEEIRDEAWSNMYSQLLELKEKQQKGMDVKKPQRKTWADQYEQLDLRNWEMAQQDAYKLGALDSKRESMLDEIGYWNSLGLSM